MTKFETICNDGVCGDVKQFHFDRKLREYVGDENIENYDVTITHDGVEYIPHWLFFNTAHESSVYGVLYQPIDYNGDVIFGVVGCKLDTFNNGVVDSFDDVYRILTDEQYFVD